MGERVAFSGKNVDIERHAIYHNDLEQALRLYFSPSSPSYVIRFTGYSAEEVALELQTRLDELDLSSALTVLGAIEAMFRIDYLGRCYRKDKDDLSREFRSIYKKKSKRANLDRDIFEAWQKHDPANARLISGLRSAFNFRDWLAHGRYWKPNQGREYDYVTVYGLASAAFANLRFIL